MGRLKRWWRTLRARENRLWVTQVFASIAAVLLALAGAWGARFVAEGSFPDIERETLDGLLTVIAGSMLAVTTFSLSIMVGALGNATGNATPRAAPLLMADDGTRTAIAAFLSAFIYAVVAKIALGIGYYGANGRFILFLGTLAVLAWLLVTLVRWVRTLSSLGFMNNTLRKVEDVAFDALAAYWRDRSLGAREGAPVNGDEALGQAVYATRTGHLQHIDMAALQACAQQAGRELHLRVRPGTLLWPGAVIARLGPPAGEDEAAPGTDAPLATAALAERVREALTVGDVRSFDQDPRFGLIVLGEIAQRALSPAVNDPGTAIDVMGRVVRVLIDSQRADDARPHAGASASAPTHDRLTLVPLDEAALVHDAFAPIARDGAAMLEICIRMQKLLGMLARASRSGAVAHAAQHQAELACAQGLAALRHAHEREALQAQCTAPQI